MNDRQEAKLLLSLARPLESTLWLFSPPATLSSSEARRKALVLFFIGLGVLVVGFGLVVAAMRTHVSQDLVKPLVGALIMVCGLGYLLTPASLYRVLFGVPQPGILYALFRYLVAFALFVFVLFGSLVVYGQLTN